MVRCPRCDAPPLDVVRVEHLGLGRCQACHLVFDLDRAALPASGGPAPARAPRERRVKAPAGLEVWERQVRAKVAYRDEGGRRELTLRQPWKGTMSVGSDRWFSIFMSAMIFLVFGLAIAGAVLTRNSRFPGGLVGGLLPLLVALYAALANTFNHTELRVRDGRLSLRHGPLPFRRGLEVQASRIHQLYVEERVSASGRNGEPISHAYDLMMLEGEAIDATTLLRGFELPEVALFIEKKTEEALGIVDRKVLGAYEPAPALPEAGGEQDRAPR